MSPILDVQRRFRELGRIRMGERGAKGQPVRLDTWRLTSGNRGLLDEAAALWGGEVRVWEGAPTEGQWELTTATAELPIIIPPGRDPVSQWMEQWTRGGCSHRCDGRTNVAGDDPVPCSCDPAAPACKPYTRLSVMLPDLPDVGVWRMETHGWNAAAELPGTVELIRAAAESGRFVEGRLRIEERKQVRDGKTSRFIVPVLDLGVRMRELASGAPVGALNSPAPVGLPAGPDVDTLARGLIETAGDAQELANALTAVGITRGMLTDPATHARATEIALSVRAAVDLTLPDVEPPGPVWRGDPEDHDGPVAA